MDLKNETYVIVTMDLCYLLLTGGFYSVLNYKQRHFEAVWSFLCHSKIIVGIYKCQKCCCHSSPMCGTSGSILNGFVF